MSATYDPNTQWVTLGDHDYSDNATISVKDDTGETVQVNTEDIGKSIKAIGDGVVSAASTFSRINYVWNNSGTSWNSNIKFTLPKIRGHVQYAAGPMRTATYTTAADTMNYIADTAGFTWHVDNNIGDGMLYAYDGEQKLKVIDQKTIDKANKKSIKLLKEWLSPAEYKYLMEEGNLELPSQHEKDTIYIVNKDPMKRIGIKKKGKVVEKSLCIHASHAYPTGDILLANIMLLKTDEKKFLEIANVHDYIA